MISIEIGGNEAPELAERLTRTIAFVDIETTGGDATQGRITEIGVVEVSAAGIESWSTLLDPGIPISPAIEQLTGISNEMVRNQPSFRELAESLAARLDGKLFVAHNVRFDYGFLKSEFERAGIHFKAHTLCTVRLSRALFPTAQGHGLDALITRLGLQAKGRHRALADADLLWQFWQKIHELHPVEVVNAAIQSLLKHTSPPPSLPKETLATIPAAPGIYIFYGDNAVPLHVGKSSNLRQQVAAHFSGDDHAAKALRIAPQIRRIECRPSAGELGALLLEAQFSRQLSPAHHHVPHRPAALYAWQWLPNTHRPRLVSNKTIDFAHAPSLYGAFSSKLKAEDTLRRLADEHRLCHVMLGLEKSTGARGCSGSQQKRCLGCCAGDETSAAHTVRALQALDALQLKAWPYAGPVAIFESSEPRINTRYPAYDELHHSARHIDVVRDVAGAIVSDAADETRPPGSYENASVGQWHILDNWCYLGSVEHEQHIPELLQRTPLLATFDREIYGIMARRLSAGTTPLLELTAMSSFELSAPWQAKPSSHMPPNQRSAPSTKKSSKKTEVSSAQMSFDL